MSEDQFRLVVLAGPDPDRIYPLVLETVTLGRDKMSDVVLDDPEVSRQHVRLTRRADGYEIQDLGSTNGTFLNGERLTGPARALSPGHMIGLGSTISLRFEVAPWEPIPDPLGEEPEQEIEPEKEGDAEAELAAAAEAAAAEPAAETEAAEVLEAPNAAEAAPEEAAPEEAAPEEAAPEEAAPEEAAPEPDPFSDPAWREALAPRPMPEFRFDEMEPAAPEPAVAAAPVAAEPAAAADDVPSFASYQPEAAGPPPAPGGDGTPRKRRTWLITLGVILFLFCCCCALLALFAYNTGDSFLYDFCRQAEASGDVVPDICRLYPP